MRLTDLCKLADYNPAWQQADDPTMTLQEEKQSIKDIVRKLGPGAEVDNRHSATDRASRDEGWLAVWVPEQADELGLDIAVEAWWSGRQETDPLTLHAIANGKVVKRTTAGGETRDLAKAIKQLGKWLEKRRSP